MAKVESIDELDERKQELKAEIQEASERIQTLESDVLPGVILGEKEDVTEAEVSDEIQQLQSKITAREKALERLEDNVRPELEEQEARARIEEIRDELQDIKDEHDEAREKVEEKRDEFLQVAKPVLSAHKKAQSLRREAKNLSGKHSVEVPDLPDLTGPSADLRGKLILGTKTELKGYAN
jgi:DNA repair exonuclease SbcCD ATPase subunit